MGLVELQRRYGWAQSKEGCLSGFSREGVCSQFTSECRLSLVQRGETDLRNFLCGCIGTLVSYIDSAVRLCYSHVVPVSKCDYRSSFLFPFPCCSVWSVTVTAPSASVPQFPGQCGRLRLSGRLARRPVPGQRGSPTAGLPRSVPRVWRRVPGRTCRLEPVLAQPGRAARRRVRPNLVTHCRRVNLNL